MALAYVIMPYAKEFDRVYRNLIKPAVEACGLECRRTDKDMRGGNVMQNVIRDLAQANIVIADISTRRNPDSPICRSTTGTSPMNSASDTRSAREVP